MSSDDLKFKSGRLPWVVFQGVFDCSITLVSFPYCLFMLSLSVSPGSVGLPQVDGLDSLVHTDAAGDSLCAVPGPAAAWLHCAGGAILIWAGVLSPRRWVCH